MLNNEGHNYCFIKDSKYHYIAVTNLSDFSKIFKRHGRDRFCVNCFANFQTDEKFEQHQKTCLVHKHTELEILGKFKIIFNKDSSKMQKVPGNILKYLLQNKFLQPPFIIVGYFETMIVETDNRSNLGELIQNKAVSLTVKTSDYILIGFALAIYYSEDTGNEK